MDVNECSLTPQEFMLMSIH